MYLSRASLPPAPWVNVGVNLSIALILVGVDLRSVILAGPAMLVAFALGALGSVVGAISATLLLGSQIGSETWKLAGQYTGTYIGGGMNLAALGRAFDTSNDLFTAAIAADVLVSTIWLMTCLTVPMLLGASRSISQNEVSSRTRGVFTLEHSLQSTREAISLEQIATLCLVALGLVWSSGRMQELVPGIPQVLWLTTMAVLAAQAPAVRRLQGGPLLGNYLLLLFRTARCSNT